MTDRTTAAPITTTGTDAEKISTESKQGWRKLLPVHPAAELFPLMSEPRFANLPTTSKSMAFASGSSFGTIQHWGLATVVETGE
jgi:hypothetical protein